MGIIYKARDLSLDRVAALKVLRDDLRAQPQIVARFRREAQAAALLNHPNIVQIYAVGTEGDVPFIAMEFIDGLPLSSIMQRHGPMPWQRAFGIGEQVARALACAHAAHVIHRDIKPPNILVDQDEQAFVTDFGIAKILTVEEQLTVDGTRLGTPQYMSPERCRDGEVTAESDIYSLGVLLFQMISGRLPFEASSSVELVRKILSAQPTRLREYAPLVPENVERLVAYLVEKKPENRPHSADDVCKAIELVRAGRSLDDEHTSMASALEDFRRTGPPKPSWVRDEPTTIFLPSSALARFTLRWFGTPFPGRIITAALLIVAIGIGLGFAIAPFFEPDPAVVAMNIINADMKRWEHSAELASFLDAAPGIQETRLHLKDFALASGIWSGSRFYALFNGVPLSARAQQTCIATIHVEARYASIVIPPLPPAPFDATEQSLMLLSAYRIPPIPSESAEPEAEVIIRYMDLFGQDRRGRIFLCGTAASSEEPDSLFARGPHDPIGALPEGLNARRIRVLDQRPGSTEYIAAIRNEQDTSCYLAALSRQPDGAWRADTLTDDGPPITAVYYAPNGASFVFMRDLGASRQIWVAPRGVGPQPAFMAAEGKLSMGRSAFSPDSSRLAYSMEQQDGSSTLFIAPIAGGPSESAGEGATPCWHPSGAYLAALSATNGGIRQLVAIGAVAPYSRRVITQTASSLLPWCSISPDGQWLATAPMNASEATVYFIRLAPRI